MHHTRIIFLKKIFSRKLTERKQNDVERKVADVTARHHVLEKLIWMKSVDNVEISTYFVICLQYPASSTSPPSSQITLSKHSSDSMMAMYMSWTLSSMLAAGDSSRMIKL